MDEIVYFYPTGHEQHFELGHPERPERVEAVQQSLAASGWWQAYPHLEPVGLSQEFLTTVHTPDYLSRLRAACSHGQHLDMDTYTTRASWQMALNAAGGAAAVVEAVWHGRARCGLALTRPPGHHATANQGMGFCLINNIAVAAEHLLHGAAGRASRPVRLAIVDLDLHHGNGTQDIFWKRGDVLYISTHQSPLYPGTGRIDEVGAGAGEGTTANFPLPPGTGDQGFHIVMEELILPLLDRFMPEMLLLSVGFDPHWLDPLGHLMLSAAGFGSLIASLTNWAQDKCNGKIALFLEGGYDLNAGAACMQAAVAVLLKQPWQDPLGPSPRPEGRSWEAVVRAARIIWKL
jgi:acetoin utilization deacetylase AcuC-like enzyme